MAVCKNCGGYHRPHHMCLECGFYNGRVVIDMKAQKAARDQRIQAKKEAINAQAAQTAAAEASPDADATPTEPTEEKK